jgi:TIR domain/CRISPR-associated protein NE0113 (Cas_NE0113)
MTTHEEKDFFISYHQADRKWAEWIAWHLEANGYSCVFRPWDFRPGSNFVMEEDKALDHTKRIVMVLSPDYLAHQSEWTAVVVRNPDALLPVRVRECNPAGRLATITPIDIVPPIGESVARDRLLAGISGTRLKPSQSPHYPGPIPIFPGPSNVLIASLGDSPVVVSSMYDLLTQQEGLIIDRMIVLYPEGEKNAYKYVKEVFSDVPDLQPEELPFEDANTWRNACIFLKELYTRLNACQEKGDTVYLSLAGGRKSMAALAAWVAPIFPCIAGLYHVIDKQEENFFATADLDTFDTARRFRALHPNLSHLILVKLPFEKVETEQPDFQALHVALRSATHDSLSAREFETDMALITLQKIYQGGPFLNIEVTKQATEQFIVLCEEKPKYARALYEHIMQMSDLTFLLNQESTFNIDDYKQKHGKKSSVILHSFTNLKIPVRPVFYTLPNDVYTHEDHVEKVIICSLETKSADDTRSLAEIAQTSIIPVQPEANFFDLPPVSSPVDSVLTPVDSVLIVPLGKSPMVATQLYTLLREQQQHTIHEVVLIYPQLSVEIHNSVDIIRKALREEYNFTSITRVGIPDLGDITSENDCWIYQKYLENEIERVKNKYPVDYQIDLALSGGRKGMTAMTIFAALKNRLPYVYHTLITDDTKSVEIEEDTTIKALTGLDKKTRNARLFLHEYQTDGYNPYANFTLFRVPVFTADGW